MTLYRVGGVSRQRGYWLRCFLGAAMAGALAHGAVATQLEMPGPEHLTHVEGVVVNTSGQPVAGIDVSLMRDGKVAFSAKTNDVGGFRIEHVSGHFDLTVARSQFAPAAREIVVTEEIVTRAERKKLYVILGPGACADACSAVLTSKREFDRTIREKNRH